MYEYSCKLDRVVDGDTVMLNIDCGFSITIKQSVRLLGLNTPEMNDSDAEQRNLAKAAKGFVKEFFEMHDSFIITTKKDKRGKYGRILGDIYGRAGSDLRHLNRRIIEAGHAEAIE